MLKKTQKASGPSKKRVHWDASVEDNKNKSGAKRQKIDSTKHKKKLSISQLIEDIKADFNNGAYEKLEQRLNEYRPSTKTKILSVDNYYLFLYAASRHNVKALHFLVNAFPQAIAYDMLHADNLSPFKCFLICTRTLEELKQLDHNDRIEGFKIFLTIDHESVQNAFDEFEANSLEKQSMKASVKKDLNIALAQLREEGIIPMPKPSLNSMQNDLLKHINTHDAVTSVHATSSLYTPHSLVTEEDSDISIQIINKPETSNTLHTDSSTKGALRSRGI